MNTRILSALGALLLATSTAGAHAGALPTRSSMITTDPADGAVYVANPDSDTVTKLAPYQGTQQVVLWEAAVGDYPRTVAVIGGSVYATNQNDDSVSRLATADGSPMGEVGLGAGCAPYGVAAHPDGTGLYVSCQGTQEVVVLDPALGIVARIALDWPQPRSIAVGDDEGRVFVTHFLTNEPSHDAHVSEIDVATNALTARRHLAIPVDRSTCETQNSGQGVTNLVNSIALPPAETPAAGQLWVGGTLQNTVTKGLFRRYAPFRSDSRLALFDLPCPNDAGVSCMFDSFPRGGETASLRRNVFKASFHDITRFVIWKLDIATGAVVGKIDVDEANHATDIAFSPDGLTAYAVDQTFHSYHAFNVLRGQDGNPSTLFASVAKFGPFSADPTQPCDADALGSVTSESPFILSPQVQITPLDAGDPIRLDGVGMAVPVATGVDFDTRRYHTTGEAEMRPVADAVGSTPSGIALSGDGCVAYVANYLARNVVPVSARPGCGPSVDFRCSRDLSQSCTTRNDCATGTGFCNHPGGPACSTDADCPTGQGPCIGDNRCIPLIGADPAPVTALVSEEIPAEILDGKILFNTSARDASVPNVVGLGEPAPGFNRIVKGCSDDTGVPCDDDSDCIGLGSCVVTTLPGEVVSTAHDASYVTCTACHVDFGGQDGRTWDFSQLGASLRNTMDLRGRSNAAPGTCGPASGDQTKLGQTCHFDAECGKSCQGGANDGLACVTTAADCPDGICVASGPGACRPDPSMTPPHVAAQGDHTHFNPMVTVHWNGDRMEVEAFEFTFRQLLGASDCDGIEHDPNKCLGALFPRSLLISSSVVPDQPQFLGDLRTSLRNVMIMDPLMARELNATVRLTHMADFTYSLTQFPRNPNLGADGASPSEAAQRGRAIFNDSSTDCASCHNGPTSTRQLFTDKRPNPGFVLGQPAGADANNPFVRHDVGTANLFDRTDPDVVAAATGARQNSIIPIPGSRGVLAEYVTPVLNDVWNTPPFLHDGVAATLLDVVRPCSTQDTDCNQPGTGRNVDEAHGTTRHLTPQQLNDLVAFQKAPHNPVGSTGSTIQFGELALKKLLVNFGKQPGKGSFKVIGTANPGSSPIDPTNGGLTLTFAVPGGEEMALFEIAADAGAIKASGNGKKFKYAAKNPLPELGKVSVVLKQLRSGGYKVVAKGKKADLGALQNGARDVTVALVSGGTQFVKNGMLDEKKQGRILALGK